MTELAIDTAGAYCSAALRHGEGCEGGARISARFEPMGRGQAERILPMIEALLLEAGLDYSDLDKILCTIGPGSFTGVRIGIALAKGLALANGTPLSGAARSLVIGNKYARMEVARPGRFAVIIDAGRDEIYGQGFSLTDGAFAVETPPSLVRLDEVDGFFKTHEIEFAIGPAVTGVLLGTLLEPLGGVPEAFTVVDGRAEDLLHIDEKMFDHGEAVRPLYLRAADAKPQVGKALKRQD